MLITNNGSAPITMNLRDGSSYQLRPGVPTSVPDSATTMIDDSKFLIDLFNAGTLTVTTDAGGAFSGFPTSQNASDAAVGKMLDVRAKVDAGGKRSLVDAGGGAVPTGGAALRHLIDRHSRARTSNPRIKKIPCVIGAEGSVTLTSGQVGVYIGTVIGSAARYPSEVVALTGSNSWPANSGITVSPVCKIMGGLPDNHNGGIGGMSFYGADKATKVYGSTTKFRWLTNEPMPIFTYCTGPTMNIRIEDENGYAELDQYPVFSTGSGIQIMKLDLSQLGGSKWRIIEFHMEGPNKSMRGYRCRPEYSFAPPPDIPLTLMLTTSLGDTITGTQPNPNPGGRTMSAVLADLLGHPNLYAMPGAGSSWSGTGPAGTAQVNGYDRVELAYAMGLKPKEIVFELSTNERGTTTLVPQAVRTIKRALELWPDLESVINIGPFREGVASAQAQAAADDLALREAVMGIGDPRVEHVLVQGSDSPYITGEGNTSTATSSWTGSANRYLESGDAIHWNATGNYDVADRLAVDIGAARHRIAARIGA